MSTYVCIEHAYECISLECMCAYAHAYVGLSEDVTITEIESFDVTNK